MATRWEIGNEETHYFNSYDEAIEFINSQPDSDLWRYFPIDAGRIVDFGKAYKPFAPDYEETKRDGKRVPESQ